MAVSSKWRYEPETKTIRADPSNHWIASMDSWDAAVDHDANARLIAAAPDLLATLRLIAGSSDYNDTVELMAARELARAAIAKVEG